MPMLGCGFFSNWGGNALTECGGFSFFFEDFWFCEFLKTKGLFLIEVYWKHVCK